MFVNDPGGERGPAECARLLDSNTGANREKPGGGGCGAAARPIRGGGAGGVGGAVSASVSQHRPHQPTV